MPTRRRASSYQLLKLLEATGQIGVWSVNLRTGEMNGSLGLANITGLAPDESPLGLLGELLHPVDRVAHGELVDMLYSGRALDHTVRIVRPDRTIRWISVKAQIVLDGDHRPARAEGIAFDVTGPHEARQLAEQSMARYHGLVHAIAGVVWTASTQGLVRPSTTWQALTGQTGPQMQGDGWLAAIHPDDRARTEAAWRTAVESMQPYKADYRVLCADGTAGMFNSRAVPLHDVDGSVREWIGIMQMMPRGAYSSPSATTPAPLGIGGPLVRGARAMLNWSVTDLAAAAGVSVSSIRRLEEGHDTVQIRTREAICEALRIAGISFIMNNDGNTGIILGST